MAKAPALGAGDSEFESRYPDNVSSHALRLNLIFSSEYTNSPWRLYVFLYDYCARH